MIDYAKIAAAVEFYRKLGYQPIEAPWTISRQAWGITSPTGATAYEVDGKFLVASGEQSFLQLILDGELLPGMYQCVTPCFRDEKQHTDLTRPYFLKVELIKTYNTASWEIMMEHCLEFFKQYVPCSIVKTQQDRTDPLSISETFDIQTDDDTYIPGVELGSYGLREHKSVGEWAYATGCAEPRLSQAIKSFQENK